MGKRPQENRTTGVAVGQNQKTGSLAPCLFSTCMAHAQVQRMFSASVQQGPGGVPGINHTWRPKTTAESFLINTI